MMLVDVGGVKLPVAMMLLGLIGFYLQPVWQGVHGDWLMISWWKSSL